MTAYTERDRKHLEFIQKMISRMNSSSFQLKQWIMPVVAMSLALNLTFLSSKFVLMAFLPILVFWVLDADYLLQERRWRILRKRFIAAAHASYDLNPNQYLTKVSDYVKSAFARSVWPFYVPLGLVVFFIFLYRFI